MGTPCCCLQVELSTQGYVYIKCRWDPKDGGTFASSSQPLPPLLPPSNTFAASAQHNAPAAIGALFLIPHDFHGYYCFLSILFFFYYLVRHARRLARPIDLHPQPQIRRQIQQDRRCPRREWAESAERSAAPRAVGRALRRAARRTRCELEGAERSAERSAEIYKPNVRGKANFSFRRRFSARACSSRLTRRRRASSH